MDYLYDGSFEGLLTCIYHNYKTEKADGIYECHSYQQTILNQYQQVETNSQYADIVYNAINTKLSKETLIFIYYAFLCSDENKENDILKFIRFAFKQGKQAINMFTNDNVYNIAVMRKKVVKERHFVTGVLRFTEINGILYAKYTPDNNITEILVPHFADRLRNEKFIIHDARRKIAAIYANDNWEMVDASSINMDDATQQEKNIAKLWKHYFDTIGIENRKNPDLQVRMVPVRYRKNMVEFNVLDDKN